MQRCVSKVKTKSLNASNLAIGVFSFAGCTSLKEVRIARSADYIKDGPLRSFEESCIITPLEPHIRAIFLLCLKSSSKYWKALCSGSWICTKRATTSATAERAWVCGDMF